MKCHCDKIQQIRGKYQSLFTVCSHFNTFVCHFCISVDSLSCNKCSFGLVGICISTSEETCSTNTSVCFTGKASTSPPNSLKANTPFSFKHYITTQTWFQSKSLQNTDAQSHKHRSTSTPWCSQLTHQTRNSCFTVILIVKSFLDLFFCLNSA